MTLAAVVAAAVVAAMLSPAPSVRQALTPKRVVAALSPPPALASTVPGSPPAGQSGSESSGSYWRWAADQRPVTWGVDVFYGGMSQRSQISAFTEAFRRWEAVSGIRFRRVTACGWFVFNDSRCARPLIRISFQPRGHGSIWDNHFASGEGGHGFYPCPSSFRMTGCGDIHLANYLNWSWSSLVATAVHEIGHAIGIPHAPSWACPGSLMCPYGGPGSWWEINEAVARYGR